MGFTVFGILDSRPLLVLLASFDFWVCSLMGDSLWLCRFLKISK